MLGGPLLVGQRRVQLFSGFHPQKGFKHVECVMMTIAPHVRWSADWVVHPSACTDGLPWVSLRELLFHASRGDAPKVALDQIFEDDHHPVELGHQCVT